MAARLAVKKFILCYDIPEDRPRARLARLCERYGVRVQYSVFEFRLAETDHVAFRGELERGGWLDGKHALLIYASELDNHIIFSDALTFAGLVSKALTFPTPPPRRPLTR